MSSSANAVTLDCWFFFIDWQEISDNYACDTQINDIHGGNKENVTGVTGDHLGFRNNDDVKTLTISRQPLLTQIPKDIARFFKNIEGLEVRDCQLSSITSEDLRPFPALTVLNIEENNLVSLSGDLFVFTPNLIWLRSLDNRIQHVGYGLLDNLHNLKYASFSRNDCIDMSARNPAELAMLKEALRQLCPYYY